VEKKRQILFQLIICGAIITVITVNKVIDMIRPIVSIHTGSHTQCSLTLHQQR